MTPSRRPLQLSLGQIAVVEIFFATVGIGIVLFRHTLNAIPIAARATEPVVGMVVSATLGWLLGAALLRSRLRPAVLRASLPFRPVTSATWSILLVSALAGVGEELLFRAALQPWVGIWAASFGFALIHSGTARLQEGLSSGKLTYVFSTLLAGLALGYLYQSAGLVTSMSAHMGLDMALLFTLAPAMSAQPPLSGAA